MYQRRHIKHKRVEGGSRAVPRQLTKVSGPTFDQGLKSQLHYWHYIWPEYKWATVQVDIDQAVNKTSHMVLFGLKSISFH